MNYRDISNHNYTALLHYTAPIISQLWPAIATLGFLSLIPFLGLGSVFSNGIMEFLASLTLPLSLAFAVFFCGATLLVNEDSVLGVFVRRCCNYWTTFSISLCAAVLGVVVGLVLPYWCATSITGVAEFILLGLLAGGCYGLLAHHTGVFAFSGNTERLGRFKPWFGICMVLLGLVIAAIATYNQWLKLSDF